MWCEDARGSIALPVRVGGGDRSAAARAVIRPPVPGRGVRTSFLRGAAVAALCVRRLTDEVVERGRRGG